MILAMVERRVDVSKMIALFILKAPFFVSLFILKKERIVMTSEERIDILSQGIVEVDSCTNWLNSDPIVAQRSGSSSSIWM